MSVKSLKMPKRVNSVEELKAESAEGADFFIVLDFGVRSRKRIRWDGEHFYILNCIDNTKQRLTPKELHSGLTNIGKAIDKGAFFKEEE
jgi:hypothetical protein